MVINLEENKEIYLTLLRSVQRPGIEALIGWLEMTDFFEAPCSAGHHLNIPGGLVQHSLNVFRNLRDLVFLALPENVRGFKVPEDSGKLASLCHDFGKINIYKSGGDLAEGRQLSWARELLLTRFQDMTDAEKTILVNLGYVSYDLEGPSTWSKICRVSENIPKAHASSIIDWLKDGYGKKPMPAFPLTYSTEDSFPIGHGEKAVILVSKFVTLTDAEALAIRWHMGAFDPYALSYPMNKQFEAAVNISPLVPLLISADYLAAQVMEREDG
jgi:hypothetical protein